MCKDVFVYSKEEIDAFDRLIIALCRDYGRRRRLIEEADISRRVRMELVYLNGKIFDAAAEACGVHLAEIFIKEIGNSIGYAHSEAAYMSEGTYKAYKNLAKRNIVKKLYLE